MAAVPPHPRLPSPPPPQITQDLTRDLGALYQKPGSRPNTFLNIQWVCGHCDSATVHMPFVGPAAATGTQSVHSAGKAVPRRSGRGQAVKPMGKRFEEK